MRLQRSGSDSPEESMRLREGSPRSTTLLRLPAAARKILATNVPWSLGRVHHI